MWQNEPLPKVTDPKKAILGKWEIIEDSFGPIRYPGYYREYRQDSVLFDYVSEDDTSYSKYWFVDSILYKSHVYINHSSGDTILVDIQAYRYRFLNYNKLRLDLQAPALNTKLILSRIK